MLKIPIKPLSVNEAWKGRRFKTDAYKSYSAGILLILPKRIDIPDGPLEIEYRFHVSNPASDWDNPIKPVQDIICFRYGINDKRIMRAVVEKVICPKGQECTEFELRPYAKNNP